MGYRGGVRSTLACVGRSPYVPKARLVSVLPPTTFVTVKSTAKHAEYQTAPVTVHIVTTERQCKLYVIFTRNT